MEEQLLARIELLKRMRGDKDREEFVDFVCCQICFYGGDTTAQLLNHYGERLNQEVNRLITA